MSDILIIDWMKVLYWMKCWWDMPTDIILLFLNKKIKMNKRESVDIRGVWRFSIKWNEYSVCQVKWIFCVLSEMNILWVKWKYSVLSEMNIMG